jgi:two-component system chemotaxis sensor kinase CheA
MQYSSESMLEMFIFETTQLIEQLEELIMSGEKCSGFTEPEINEIFRIMHTIKGSAAMMMYENISSLAHSIEDLFFFIREQKPQNIDCSALSDLVLESMDFIRVEIEKIKNGDEADGVVTYLNENIKDFLNLLKDTNDLKDIKENNNRRAPAKQKYYISPDIRKSTAEKKTFKAIIQFEEGCEMENIRAFSVVHNLKGISDEISHIPEDIIDNDASSEIIRKEGFVIYLRADISYEMLRELLMQTLFLKELELVELDDQSELDLIRKSKKTETTDCVEYKTEICADSRAQNCTSAHPAMISVNVQKLDRLMDLVGEMVIAEAMVIQNPDLEGLELNSFQKAARQLNKITGEIQDMVMSIRMVPLSTTFHKMHRIVRDMSKKLGKEAELEIIGEETEVDKNIIEHISDPLMHLVRNAIDHGIETCEERVAKGKPRNGTITLEAKNSGSDVLIIVKDDGKGLDREKIISKALKNGILHKDAESMTDKEIFNLILLPGFSTKDDVSEYSGRGVGMDVVVKNIEAVGGSILIDSIPGEGSSITLKIPLTLAIIDGMTTKVGNSRFTIPTISIRESFRPKENDIITDPDRNEMIMVRGQCYPILRLHEIYRLKTDVMDFTKGILIMVEQDERSVCLFVDELLGQQQVVVKSLPNYIRNYKKINGLAGCTLLGDGSISLILDIAGIIGMTDQKI